MDPDKAAMSQVQACTRRRHSLLELGRGLEVCAPWSPPALPASRADRLATLLPLARHAVRLQARALEDCLAQPAGAVGEPPNEGARANHAMAQIARASAKELRRRGGRLLDAWRRYAAMTESADEAHDPIQAEADSLARWLGTQLGFMEPGEPARAPLLCALVIASWGDHTLPSINARAFFAPNGADTVWLGHHLADEITDLARGQTLWELATARWQPLQDLIWLSRGVRSRPDLVGWDRWRRFPWPPPLPWFDGLDRLRALLLAERPPGEGALTPDTALPLRTLADYQRYASTLDTPAGQLDVHALDHVPVAHLFESIGVPTTDRPPVSKRGVEDLWDFASEEARRRYSEGLIRELGAIWAPMAQSIPIPRSGFQRRPLRWRLVLKVHRRTALLELGPLVDEVRLRVGGQLWKVDLVGSTGSPVASEARYRVEPGALKRNSKELVVRWREAADAPRVRGLREGGSEHELEVLGCWQEHPQGCWEEPEGIRGAPACPGCRQG